MLKAVDEQLSKIHESLNVIHPNIILR